MSLYLPEDIQHRVAEAARAHGVSEADYMREAITRALSEEFVGERPRPRLPLFDSGDPSLARDIDEEIVVERRQPMLPVFELSEESLTAERIDGTLAEGFGRDGLGTGRRGC